MRKQTKIVAALSATALLALGASAVTFAAGWDNSTGTWQYLDNNGSAVTDVWRKSGDYWFYLDSDGNMATDKLVEKDSDFYYVNAEGAMVTNQWVALDSDSYDSNSDDGEAEYRWYYFGADGKAYRNKKSNSTVTTSELKTINGKKYAFDADGKMLYGWVSETNAEIQTDDAAWTSSKYYFGGWNDGAAQTGWVQLTVDTSTVSNDTDSDTYWFWFDSNGKKKSNGKKVINGATYYFDQYGRMVDEWADASENDSVSTVTTSSQIVYVNGDGSTRKNQWVWAVPAEDYAITMAGSEDSNDYTDDEYSWWWTQANGKIFTDGLKKIKGKYYAFDKYGRMLSGLVKYDGEHYIDIDEDNVTGEQLKTDKDYQLSDGQYYYFFGDEATDGSRKTGYVNVELNDDTYQLYFGTDGKASTKYQSKIKKYTSNGVVLKANTDDGNYAVLNDDQTDVEYYSNINAGVLGKMLVNASGTVQKNVKNLKDNNDIYYYTNASGEVTYAGEYKAYTKSSASHSVEVKNTVDGKEYTYYTEK